MLLESVEYKGVWWISGSEERLSGVLKYTPEQGVRLTLFGMLKSNERHFLGSVEVRHEVILGITSVGKSITLVDCLEDDYTLSAGVEGAPTDSTYRVRLAFIGEHFPEQKDVRFTAVRVGAPNLTTFVGTTGIGSGPASRQPHEHNYSVSPPQEFKFSMGTFHVETVHQQKFWRPTFNNLSVSEEAFFDISASDAPKPLEEFLDGPVRSLHTLLELVSDGSLPLSTLIGTSSAKSEIAVLRSQQTPKVDELGHPAKMPFTLKTLESNCPVVCGRWHDARQKIGPAFDLYFSVMRHSDMPLEHQFLFLVQAIEIFHRRTRLNEVDPPEEHQRRLLEILFSVPAKFHDWLGRVIGDYSNEPRLVRRVREVYDLMPETVRKLLGDRNEFARRITDTRNYLTHFSEGLKPRALTEIGELWGGVQQLSAMLKLLFIQSLGLDENAVLGTVWGNHILQRLHHAAEQQQTKKTAATVSK
jgi:hypothetical protein